MHREASIPGPLNLALRFAEAMDAPRLAELAHGCGLESWSEASIEAWLASSSSFGVVAHAMGSPDAMANPKAPAGPRREADELIGFAIGSVVLDEATLMLLAVEPSWRGRGAGRTLLGAFEGDALGRGAGMVLLEVAEDNEVARGLYASIGYSVVGRRRDYYPSGATALVMRRNLASSG